MDLLVKLQRKRLRDRRRRWTPTSAIPQPVKNLPRGMKADRDVADRSACGFLRMQPVLHAPPGAVVNFCADRKEGDTHNVPIVLNLEGQGLSNADIAQYDVNRIARKAIRYGCDLIRATTKSTWTAESTFGRVAGTDNLARNRRKTCRIKPGMTVIEAGHSGYLFCRDRRF
ncbi:hypothetical protein [Paraburkholderia sp.]|uniref:hypothetical protein n=1 Tax=Paraburkholderia sp. TaxID=1926495 RepID=UPI003D6EE847